MTTNMESGRVAKDGKMIFCIIIKLIIIDSI